VGAGLDLWSKNLAHEAYLEYQITHSPRNPDTVIATYHCLNISWAENKGAVLGVGQNQTGMFIAFTFLAIALLVWLFADSKRHHVGLHIFLACVVAGAVGNLYDRITFGHVRDFLQLNFKAEWATWGQGTNYIWPYVFNVADVFISIGVGGLFLVWFTTLIKQRRTAARQTADQKAA
jgi:signal peptidase II